MRSIAVLVAAAIIILGAAIGKPPRAQQVKDDALKGAVERNTEERPFGGPPPMQRGISRRVGKKCSTERIVCAVDPPKAIGATCTCRSKGKKVRGKVTR